MLQTTMALTNGSPTIWMAQERRNRDKKTTEEKRVSEQTFFSCTQGTNLDVGHAPVDVEYDGSKRSQEVDEDAERNGKPAFVAGKGKPTIMN